MNTRSTKSLLLIQFIALSMIAAADIDVMLDVDNDGRLLGASNVLVEGVYYDVQFTEGSCISVYDGCDEPSDFPFPSYQSAHMALESLLTNVLVDVPGVGNFDTDPRLTNGCFIDIPAAEARCFIILPIEGSGAAVHSPLAFINDASVQDPIGIAGLISFPANWPLGQFTADIARVWSTWTLSQTDSDNDGIVDSQDNCTLYANGDQRDTNGDGYGNRCDPDITNDGIVNFADVAMWVPFFNTATTGDADFNGDGFANFGDYPLFPLFFLQAPGPSGLVNE